MKKFLPMIFAVFFTVLSCDKNPLRSQDSFYSFLDVSQESPSLFTEGDWSAMIEGSLRMSFYVEDGILKSDVISSEQINVSERLYGLLKQVVELSNEKGVFSFSPSTKSSLSEEPRLDCVARALAQWGDYTYEEIESWIEARYGNGVPIRELYNVFNNFYEGTLTMSGAYAPMDSTVFGEDKTVGIYAPGNGYLHMVNIVGRMENGDFRALDYQSDTCDVVIPLERMSYVFFKPSCMDTVVYDYADEAVLRRLFNL